MTAGGVQVEISDCEPDEGHVGVPASERKRNALAAVRRSLDPAAPDRICEWLADLALLSPGRRAGEEEAERVVELLTERLAVIPGDLVHDALLRRSWEWFPDLAAIEEIVSPRFAARRLIHDLLESHVPAEIAPTLSPEEAEAARKADAARRRAFIDSEVAPILQALKQNLAADPRGHGLTRRGESGGRAA